MATTSNTYTGNGSNKLFSITFPYLDESDIDVYLNDTLQTITTQYIFANATTIEFVTAPSNGAVVLLDRSTDDSDNPATFFPGSSIKAADLNENFDQTLYVVQELGNQVGNKVNKSGDTMSGILDMGGNLITTLGYPSSDGHAANKLYVDSAVGGVPGIPGHTRWTITATASQTLLSGTGLEGNTLEYSPSREEVYVNGALLLRNYDYTANDGITITMLSPLLLGDSVDIRCVNNLAFGITGLAADVTFVPDGTGAVSRSVNSKLKDVVSVKDFGAVGDGVADDTAAIQAAINASNNVLIPPGNYRCDSTITINSTYTNRKLVTMTAGTKLQRLSAYSATQGPVIALLGNYGHFDGGFGEIASENPSPRGVVALGQQDVTGGINGLYWSFVNCDVRCKTYATVPTSGATVGVYIPSSQPNSGSNSANYFGTVSNVRVFEASIAYFLTDIANAHTFVNCSIDFFWHYGWYLRGAYGNTIYGGFINGCLQNGGYAVYLGNKQLPSATYAATHQSSNNNIFGISIELYTSGNYGVYIPAGVGGYDSAHNFVQVNWNSSGTAVTDLTGGTTNTIYDGSTTFRLGENLEMPDQTISSRNLLRVGKSSYASAHCIAKTPPSGGPVLIVENNTTTSQANLGLQITNNTSIIGWNSYQIYCYHTATASTVFAVLDNGNVQNTNNSYGAISDIKLKENIVDANSQWDDIKAIKIRNYNFKTGQTHKQIGVVAQEVELISPGLVDETVDRNQEGEDLGTITKNVNYSVLYMKAVKALQEAMERIEVLETRLNTTGIA